MIRALLLLLLSNIISAHVLAGACSTMKKLYPNPAIKIKAGYGPYFIDGKPSDMTDFWGSTYCRLTDAIIKSKSNLAAVKDEVVFYPHFIDCEDSNDDDISMTFSNTAPDRCEATGSEVTIFCKAGNGMNGIGFNNIAYNLGWFVRFGNGKQSHRTSTHQPDATYQSVKIPSFVDEHEFKKNHPECKPLYVELKARFYNNLVAMIQDGWYNALLELLPTSAPGLKQIKNNYWTGRYYDKKKASELNTSIASYKLFDKKYDFDLKCIMQTMSDEDSGRGFPWFSKPLTASEVGLLARQRRIVVPVTGQGLRVTPCKILNLGNVPKPEVGYCYQTSQPSGNTSGDKPTDKLTDKPIFKPIDDAQTAFDMFVIQNLTLDKPECL